MRGNNGWGGGEEKKRKGKDRPVLLDMGQRAYVVKSPQKNGRKFRCGKGSVDVTINTLPIRLKPIISTEFSLVQRALFVRKLSAWI